MQSNKCDVCRETGQNNHDKGQRWALISSMLSVWRVFVPIDPPCLWIFAGFFTLFGSHAALHPKQTVLHLCCFYMLLTYLCFIWKIKRKPLKKKKDQNMKTFPPLWHQLLPWPIKWNTWSLIGFIWVINVLIVLLDHSLPGCVFHRFMKTGFDFTGAFLRS